MDKAELSDRLDRTYEMEETMVEILVNLCHPEALDMKIPEDIREKIRDILLGIKEDSLRHKKMVLEIKNGLK